MKKINSLHLFVLLTSACFSFANAETITQGNKTCECQCKDKDVTTQMIDKGTQTAVDAKDACIGATNKKECLKNFSTNKAKEAATAQITKQMKI